MQALWVVGSILVVLDCLAQARPAPLTCHGISDG